MSHRIRRRPRPPAGPAICALALLVTLTASGLTVPASAAVGHRSVIIAGAGGEPPYIQQFQAWGVRLREALVRTAGHPPESIILLSETGEEADGRSDRATVLRTLADLASGVGPGSDLFVYLIGHGSHREAARLNLVGPDITARDLLEALRATRARSVTIVNTASSSAAFVNAMSGEDRIVCASTKSVDERNATRFAEYLIQALEGGSADQNRDGRVSVLEACRQAAALTEASYTAEGYLATEHAILDDNGDARGSRLFGDLEEPAPATPSGARPDGVLAARTFIRDWSFPAGTPQASIDAYQAAIAEVEAHVARKPDLDAAVYTTALESLLVRAARLHARIRTPAPP